MKQKLAIIGTGIAGMGCAHHLQDAYDLRIFEKNDYVGGHTNTVSLDEDGTAVHVDTGFMVFNKVTYPNLCRLFETLKVPVMKTEMSFSVQFKPEGLEYCGSGINGLFAQRKNLIKPSFYRLLGEIARFNRTSPQILHDPFYADYSLSHYAEAHGFSPDFLNKYLIPMSSAVWSTPMDKMLDFPIVTLVRFFYNHGFLGLNTQHQWYTVKNGSQSYRELLIAPFRDRISCNSGVRSVVKNTGGAEVILKNGEKHQFDLVIFACHADEALKMLEEPDKDQQRLLSCFVYEKNTATLHVDGWVMPQNRRAWSSWNYAIGAGSGGKLIPSTVYWMNKLQDVSRKENYFVSINAPENSIDPDKIRKTIHYEHPLFNLRAIRAQQDLPLLNENGPLYFCGSYFKYGFHEDAYTSALELSTRLSGISKAKAAVTA